MYMWAVIHTVIEARRQYTPRGVACDPGWDQADFHTLAAVLAKILKEDAKISVGTFISKVTGLSVDGIYSVVTKDQEDVKFLSQIIRLCFNKAILEKIFDAVKGAAELNGHGSVEENLKNFDGALKGAGQRFDGLSYVLPPLKAFQSDI